MHELSVPPIVTVADGDRLSDMVLDNAREVPELVSFGRRASDGSWEDVTAAEFAAEVTAVSRGLIAAGVRPGERVALMSATRYEWTLLDYAIWSAGAIVVPVYETSSAEQVDWILADSGAVAVVVETEAHLALVEQSAAAPKLRWTFGQLPALIAPGSSVTDEQAEAARTAVQADDVATIVYTSGTTGRPKGCVLTHRNLLADVKAGNEVLRPVYDEDGSTLLFLPLAHVFGRVIEIGSVLQRSKLGHTADVRRLPEDLRAFRPTFILAVPRVFEKAYNTARQTAYAAGRARVFDAAEATAIAYSKALQKGRVSPLLKARHALFDKLVYVRIRAALGGRCTHAISGGAALGERLGHFFRGAGITVLEGYGLTETSAGATLNLKDAQRVGTVGRPVPGTAVKIAEDGEILLRGANVFDGYWHNEAASAEVFADGWFRTGDLGTLDDDGYLTVTGRKKDLIVTAAGKNVAPAVLEDRLRAHPLVGQCMVVGDRQPFVGALVTIDEDAWPGWLAAHGRQAGTPVAELREDPDLRATVQEAVDEANKAVSRPESIREFRVLPVDFTEAGGELTPSLKVRRAEVLKRYAPEVAALYGAVV
ncbi:MAG TPA: long-chain fatty acid--CoA ligase [Mycobacteriales bacterium]|nr:long-chain fatty acid--CoA ligase [Mycobacteriales bacterium]